MDFIFEFLGNPSGMIIIATVMIIAFARCITKIFRMGVDFKSDIVTKDEQRDFEEEMRKDMRGYAVQIQKSVSDAMMLVLNNRLKDIDEIKKIAEEIKIAKAEMDVKLESINEKTNNAKAVVDEVRLLSNKIQRLEYNQNMTTVKTDRRSEN